MTSQDLYRLHAFVHKSYDVTESCRLQASVHKKNDDVTGFCTGFFVFEVDLTAYFINPIASAFLTGA